LSTSEYIKVNEPEEINQFQFNEEDDDDGHEDDENKYGKDSN
jgi:hypothetical protein